MPADTPSDRDVVESALRRIRTDADGTHTDSDITQLYGRAVIAEHQKVLKFNAFRRLVAIVQMHMGLITIVAKLNWMHSRRGGDIDVPRWTAFAGSDIIGFHVLLRSLFDEVAGFAKEIAPRPGEVPRPSFRAIQDWLLKDERNRALLGEGVAEVVVSCDWFVDIRAIRDDIVHHAALTLVFPEPDRILFQVHKGPSPGILLPAVMFDEQTVDFTLYAALVMARLDDFLARFAEAVFDSVESLRAVGPQDVCNRHPGLSVLASWLEVLLKSLDQRSGRSTRGECARPPGRIA